MTPDNSLKGNTLRKLSQACGPRRKARSPTHRQTAVGWVVLLCYYMHSTSEHHIYCLYSCLPQHETEKSSRNNFRTHPSLRIPICQFFASSIALMQSYTLPPFFIVSTSASYAFWFCLSIVQA
mmetsp:Transcript_10799/g.66713  ORF Transcript_10799/g.66713 Transcript_10799/m.66713 type:complete len:123 (-) Transcript_10799:987-1355(-)